MKGKLSVFGGPNDEGVSPTEGLALINPEDLASWWFRCLFLNYQPTGTTGLARRLDPDAYYLACRWDYERTPKTMLRFAFVGLRNPLSGMMVFARPADWGPNDRTGRIADLSPGLARALGVETDDEIEICSIQALQL